ncbi:major facilitator superfamily domain-containing protein [Mycena leptocephala]|nr:major facilitator superfamily domain-containing protein [Mycena leptocephala]
MPDPSSVLTPRTRKGVTFWLIFASICISLFVSALELTTVSTALPTIAADLHLDAFVWVGTAYSLASTAFLPMSGGLAEIFGRQHALLLSIGLFALGSALCGAAREQTVQGLGGGAFVPGGDHPRRSGDAGGEGHLRDSNRIVGVHLLPELGFRTWSVACVVGPIIGGGLAARGTWRWLFYLNLPISGLAAVFVVVFLPPCTRRDVPREDGPGNFIIITSTTCCTLALTWGGVTAAWTSLQVLVPLWCGLLGLAFFLLYEATVAVDPLVPFVLMCNRTSLSGYVQAFVVGLVTLCVVYFLPVYFQACHAASALHSAVLGLGVAALAPAAIVAGVLVSKTGRYRPQMWVGWGIIILGLGLLSTVRRETPVGRVVGYGVVTGVGLGFEYSTTMFPVQAPLPVSQNARALAFLTFVGSFAGVWGLTIGGTILDNQLAGRLPAAFLDTFTNATLRNSTNSLAPHLPTINTTLPLTNFPFAMTHLAHITTLAATTAHAHIPHPGTAPLAYALIPLIAALPPSFLPPALKIEVQDAFAESLGVMWAVLVGIAGVGMVASWAMRGLVLGREVDGRWALVERGSGSGVLDGDWEWEEEEANSLQIDLD